MIRSLYGFIVQNLQIFRITMSFETPKDSQTVSSAITVLKALNRQPD